MNGIVQQFVYCLLALLVWETTVTCQRLNSDTSMFDKRVPMGFQGVRGKKFDQSSNAFINPNDGLMEYKRGPVSSGFHGMRGKKLFDEPSFRSYYQYKRIPMGFHGMRGKKDQETVSYDDLSPNYPPMVWGDDTLVDLEHYLKRAPAMGFQGVRGKKDEKRAPAEGFFGMRGKKLPSGSQGFFGMRGKKFPYEFRGKFVGVRGKKLLTPSTIMVAEEGNEVDDEVMDENDLKRLQQDSANWESGDNVTNLSHVMYLLNDNVEQSSNAGQSNDLVFEKRKVQQDGFFGMRGKKNTINDN